MALVLRNSKTIPLTNTELDNNFVELSTRIDTKVSISDYTSAAVLSKLVTGVMGAESGIDSSLLRGYQPLSTNTGNSVVNRDGAGSFAANVITANSFAGKSTDSAHADLADAAVTLTTALVIAKGGTGGTTAAEARLYLGVVNKAGDTLTGKLTSYTSTLAAASIRIPEGVDPSFPATGDLWATNTGLKNRVGSVTKSVAYEDSSITGTSSNVTGVVAVANGGTGSNVASFARANLSAAKSSDNYDITSLNGLTSPLSISQGGTGATSISGARANLGILNRAGDTMAGNLSMGGYSLILGPLNTDNGKIYFESSSDANSSLIFETGDNAGFNQEKFIWRMNGGGNGPLGPVTRDVMSLNENNLLVNGGTVWHSLNHGHDSGLDADLLDEQEGSFYRNATNLNAGIVSSSRLTGTYNIDVSGTSTNITGVAAVANGGTGANSATSARSNLSAAKSGSNSDITGLSGLTTALSTAQGGTSVTSSGPAGNYLISDGSRWVSANPQAFQTFTSGLASPNPDAFSTKTVSGFDAYSSTDFPGSYYVGLTIKGVSYQAAQLAVNWNSEETKPFGLYFRANDDTSSTNAWSPWTTIWHERNMQPGSAGNVLISTGTGWNSVSPEDAGFNGYPSGAVVPFYRASVPFGWLECNGQQVSRATYSSLWQAMGSPNSGNGSTTFSLPDLRSEFVRGLDRGRGIDTNRALGSYQTDMTESHRHYIAANVTADSSLPSSPNSSIAYRKTSGSNSEYSLQAAGIEPTLGLTSYSGGTETRPRNIALMYCIKY